MVRPDMIHISPTLQAEVQDSLVFEHIVSGGDRILKKLNMSGASDSHRSFAII